GAGGGAMSAAGMESLTRLLDVVGLLGLLWLTAAGWDLARARRFTGAWLMAGGAAALLFGRLFVVVSPRVLTVEVLGGLGRPVTVVASVLPMILLTSGVLFFVW